MIKTTRKTGKKKVKQILKKKSRLNPPEKTKLTVIVKTEKDIQKILKRLSDGERGLRLSFAEKVTEEIFLERYREWEIDKIISAKPLNAKQIAEFFASSQPRDPFKTLCESFFLKACKKSKCRENDIDMVLRDIHCPLNNSMKSIASKIGSDVFGELKNTYGRDIIERVMFVLEHFKKRNSKVFTADLWKQNGDRVGKMKEIIKASDVILKKANMDVSEREVVAAIKTRIERHLSVLSQAKEVEIDLYKATQLALLGPGIPENLILKKPTGTPNETVKKAVLIILFNLLDKDRQQTKLVQPLVAAIVGNFFDDKTITAKTVENALNRK